jgi:nitrogen fixation protein NifQ
VYRDLTGVFPEAANIDGDANFDRHVLASILALASSEGGSLAAQAGLTDTELGDLLSHCFPARSIESSGDHEASVVDADEIEMVREHLLENRSSEDDCGRWLAAMIERRAMEPNHLWEDLGLLTDPN